MSQLTKEQEREYYKTLQSPIHSLSEFDRMMLEANKNGFRHERFHINTTIDHGDGIECSSTYPSKHIHIINSRKLWSEDDGCSVRMCSDSGVEINGKKYKIVGDEWVLTT